MNLINEIEKALQDTEKLYRHTSKVYNGYLKSHYRGKMEAYMNILESLKDYNIIAVPKSIKLSEIIEKLNVSKWQDFQATKQGSAISIDNNNCFREYLNIEKNKITDISDDMQVNEFKWLYTLWIANVEIVDDLKEEE